MEFYNWVENNRKLFGTEYEILFAARVLPLVEGLRCDAVTAQYHFVDSDGKDRYCDFAIIESQAVRIAIEIDGYDKRGTGTGMSHEDFLDWQRRQASLASQGWHVLRFANRDVREEPHRCANYISNLLKRLREAETGLVEIVTIQSQPREVVFAHAKVDNVGLPRLAGKKVYSLLPWIIVGIVGAFALWQNGGDSHVDRAVRATAERSATPASSAKKSYVSDATPRVHATQATVASLSTVTSPAVVARQNVGVEGTSYGKLDCKNPLDWAAAKQHIGQVITVVGPLLASKPRPDITGSPLWLDVGGVYPNKSRLTVVVWGKNWPKFNVQELDARYWYEAMSDESKHASICVVGKVTEYRGVPQIELQEMNQVWIGFHPSYR